MTGIYISQLILNAALFSCIFWILTFISKSVYTNKYFNYKLNFYECGFKNLTPIYISYEINYIMLILFLLIYDGEFLALIPYSFNVTDFFTSDIVIYISFFFLWLIIALLFDYAFNALEWQI